MKTNALFVLSALLLFGGNISCGDPCKKKDCGRYAAYCDDGQCVCRCGASIGADGKCSVNDRDLFIGQYTSDGVISGGGTIGSFKLRCNPKSGDDNFNQMEIDMSEIGFPRFNGIICGNDIDIETFTDSGTADVYSGSGTRSGNILTLNISRNTVSGMINYIFTGNKN